MATHKFKFHSKSINSIAFSPVDEQTLATSSMDNTICIWTLSEDGKRATRQFQLKGHTDDVNSLAWSSDGLFLVSGSDDSTIQKWNVSTGECELVIQTPDLVFPVALSPDDKHIVSGDGFHLPARRCFVHVWDALTGDRTLGPLKGHQHCVSAVTYTPDGRRILSGSSDHCIIVWNSITGVKLFGPFIAHSDVIRSISFHPSGKTFITCSLDKTTTIWDAKTFWAIHKELFENPVVSAQYSSNGKLLLSASRDGILRVWGVEGGRVASEPLKSGSAAAFSTHGRWIVSGRDDGIVKIWEVRW